MECLYETSPWMTYSKNVILHNVRICKENKEKKSSAQHNKTYIWDNNMRNTMCSQYVHSCILFGECKLYINQG